MPLLKLETTVLLNEEKQKSLLAALSKTVAAATGKPEQYVMVTISQAAMTMSGKTANAAFVDVRAIGGLTSDTNGQLSQKICQLLHDALAIEPDRIYLNFTDVKAGSWGWNGNTFE